MQGTEKSNPTLQELIDATILLEKRGLQCIATYLSAKRPIGYWKQLQTGDKVHHTPKENENLGIVFTEDIFDIEWDIEGHDNTLPTTLSWRSSEGTHNLYHIPDFNKQTKIIDLQTGAEIADIKKPKGGFSVCPPSIHTSRNYRYEFTSTAEIYVLTLSELKEIIGKKGFGIKNDGKNEEDSRQEIINTYNGKFDVSHGRHQAGVDMALFFKHITDNNKQLATSMFGEWCTKVFGSDCSDDEGYNDILNNILNNLDYQVKKGANRAAQELGLKNGKGAMTRESKGVIISDYAQELIEKYNIVTFSDNRSMTIFNGKSYESDNMYNYLTSKIPDVYKHATNTDCAEIIGKIQRNTMVKRDTFVSPNILITNNKVIDLQQYTLKDHSPEYHAFGSMGAEITQLLPEPTADLTVEEIYDILGDTKLLKFLQSIFTTSGKVDEPSIYNLLEAFAITLLRNPTKYQKGFVLYGSAKNGKSVALDWFSNILGTHNCTHQTLQDLETNRFATAALYGKWLCYNADITNVGLKTTGKLKNLLSGDPLSVEHKGENSFTLHNQATLIFGCNEIPAVQPDNGFYRKIQIIHFPNTFEGVNRNPNMLTELKNDKEGNDRFMQLMIVMMYRLAKRGGLKHGDTTETTRLRWDSLSNQVGRFIEDMCEASEHDTTHRDMYKAFLEYCTRMGLKNITAKYFSIKMTEKFELDKLRDKDTGRSTTIFQNVIVKKVKEPEKKAVNDY